MKKQYIAPQFQIYAVDNNDILQSSIPVKSGETEGSDGWGPAQSKLSDSWLPEDDELKNLNLEGAN